jgi:DNA ligase-1
MSGSKEEVVQGVCGCSPERARELVEAGGSIERAVDIYFSQEQQPHQCNAETRAAVSTSSEDAALVAVASATNTASISSPPPGAKRAKASPKSATKQARVSSFFTPTAATTVVSGSTGISQPEEVQPKKAPSSVLLPSRKRALPESSKEDSKHAQDERLQYVRLAEVFSRMADTTKRLAKLDALQEVLRNVIDAVGGIQGDETSRVDDGRILQYTMELIVGSTLKLQVSGSAVTKAVMSVTGVSSTQLRTAYRQTGDLGDVADKYVRNQRLLVEPKPLTIESVYKTLVQISAQEGKGSQGGRQTLMVKLLRSCRASEMRFLVRTLLGNMRLGANMRTVLAALAMAVNTDTTTKDVAVKMVQNTFDYCPRLDKTCLALLVGGIPHIVKTCTLEVGTCINPMLANPAHSFEDVKKMMDGGAAIAEWKYDGVRCQAHYTGSETTLYSRHMLENTDQFPDAVQFLLEAKKSTVHSFIIDSEIVGIEVEENGKSRLLPFQNLSTRRGNKEDNERIQIRVFAFDLMFLNGKSLVKTPLHERQRLLIDSFNITDGFTFAKSISLSIFDEAALSSFLQEAVAGGAEGLMMKLTGINATENEDETKQAVVKAKKGEESKSLCQYESGVRSHTWLKVKRDYVAGFSDTIDVVPIGAWYGNGRKAQKGFLSPVLLAVYDEEEDVFRSISRCMSFTDAMYNSMREFYFKGSPYPDGVGIDEGEEKKVAEDDEAIAGEEPYSEEQESKTNDNKDEPDRVNCYPSRPTALVITNESPSIWFKPSEVFEVSFADLTLSKQHSAAAGLVDPARGVALRFPRFKRRRPDKRIDQAATTTQIAALFAKQAKQQQGGGHANLGS